MGKIQANPNKVGLAILCCCTGEEGSDNYIANCKAADVMGSCFNKLGYLVHSLGTNVTLRQLSSTFDDLSRLSLPPSYSRAVFYYFGHGNETTVSFAKDENKEREKIATDFLSASITS